MDYHDVQRFNPRPRAGGDAIIKLGGDVMSKYSRISNDEFDAALVALMEQESMESILHIPGVYEAISEHYNSEALDLATESRQEARRKWLVAIIANIGKNGFLCYFDAPYI